VKLPLARLTSERTQIWHVARLPQPTAGKPAQVS
jgi:hypothetical protein